MLKQLFRPEPFLTDSAVSDDRRPNSFFKFPESARNRNSFPTEKSQPILTTSWTPSFSMSLKTREQHRQWTKPAAIRNMVVSDPNTQSIPQA